MYDTHRQVSPCLTCTRVKDPQNCENKNCNVWRNWFLMRWEQLRSCARREKDCTVPKPLGVPLGGRHYAAPHQVETYLSTDPCKNCLCPRDLCATPCRVRRNWEQAREDVFV